MAPTELPQDVGSTKINLSMLIDFLLQKTYHELTVLSELLPRKSDIERKIEIVQFASRTRQQFVRLLALVKWAASAERVDKCQAISTILDKQSMLFIDTADMLARMSRETLVKARLPTFCLPAAVDVLTGGTYPRLPTCIRDKIIPPDPITAVEKTKTLQRLNHVIQHRLVTSKLPPEMGNMVIADGRVKFQVEHEFEVTLTVMGDEPTIPWRVLSIDFLVQDMETGDGKSLVHALQAQYIHQLVQSRLFVEEEPLIDLYKCLHSFCLSLQLQVLHFQAKQLITERWGENVRIEEYAISKKLVVSFWRAKGGVQQGQKSGHKITICGDTNDSPSYLCIQHSPPLPCEFTTECISKVTSGDLYIEKLLTHTIKAQSNVKLKELLQILTQDSTLSVKVTVDGQCPSLAIQASPNPTPTEIIVITVGKRSGYFQVSLGNGEDNTICSELENTLNSNMEHFLPVLRDARCQLYVKRYLKSATQLPATASLSLPVANFSEHKLSQLSKHKLYVRFRRHPCYCLVVEVLCGGDTAEVTTKYHLLRIKSSFGEGTAQGITPGDSSSGEQQAKRVEVKKEGRKSQERSRQSCEGTRNTGVESNQRRRPLFIVAEHMVTLNELMVDFAGSPLAGMSCAAAEEGDQRKRKLEVGEQDQESNKRQKTMKAVLSEGKSNSSYLSTFGHVVAICHARIPFIQLRKELSRHKIIYQGLTSEAGVGLAVRLSNLPLPKDCDPNLVSSLQPNVLDCVLRFPDESQRTCLLEMIMDSCPLEGVSASEKGTTRHVLFDYSMPEGGGDSGAEDKGGDGEGNWARCVVSKLLSDWCSVCKLYKHAVELDTYLKDLQSHFRHMCRVYSYNYKQLTLQYDPDKQSLVTFEWSVEQSQFVLSFGYCCGSNLSANPHCFTARHIQQEFNKHQSLPYVVQILHDTFRPLSAIAKLSTKPALGMHFNRPLMALKKFAVLPQSSTHVLLIFRNAQALEVRFRAKNLVTVRDAFHSIVDPSKNKAFLTPIQNLKVFLQLYVDEVAKVGGITSRHASTADDEAPPSPITMETDTTAVMDTPFTSPQPMSSAANLTASPLISRTSPQAPSASVNVPSPFSASPNVNSPGNIYGVGSPASQLSALLQPSPVAPQGLAQSPVGSAGLPVPSPATSLQFATPSPALAGSSGSLSHSMPITSPGSWPMSPQFSGIGQATKYRPSPTSQAASGTGLKQPNTPPRPLTARTWAATASTTLSHEAFTTLCTPYHAPYHTFLRPYIPAKMSPLERFLCCMQLKRHLQRVIQSEESLTLLKSEPSGLVFKVTPPTSNMQLCTNLQYVVNLHSSYTALLLSAKPLGQEASWKDDLATLERFFETKVARPPFKASAITAFARLLGAPPSILRDCIKIMKLEMNHDPKLKWRVKWCLSIPPNAPEIAPPGTSAVVLKNKMLFFIQLSKPIPSSPTGEEQIVVVPILHEIQNNTVQQAEVQRQAPAAPSSSGPTHAAIVSAFLKRWSEVTPRTGECTIFPAVWELAKNLDIPP